MNRMNEIVDQNSLCLGELCCETCINMSHIELLFRLEKEALVSISVKFLVSMQDLNLSCVIMETECVFFINA